MEISIGFIKTVKLIYKLTVYKINDFYLATNEYEIISTNYGKVKGRKRRNVYEEFGEYYSFEGIPYAKPPLGELRFRAPQPPETWEGVLDCLCYKSKPLQNDCIRLLTLGSEDCLYLNIYAKKLSSEKPLPVMVWIYGGGFEFGEASREIYGPDYFMQKDVLLITVDYRLGTLGFLSLKDPDLQVPGNAGLKDLVMALKWIKTNIQYFNGDPNNVTLFGESAGGCCGHILMLSQQAEGLFHKVILQSGTALNNWANTPQHDWAYRFARTIGYKGCNNDKQIYRFLIQQDARKLGVTDVTFLTKEERVDGLYFAFTPVIEPYESEHCIVNRPFKELMSSAWGNKIPAIIGGTSFEGLFLYATATKYNFIINEVADCVKLLPDDIISKHTPQELNAMASILRQTHFGQQTPNAKQTLNEYFDVMSYKLFWHPTYRTVISRSVFAKHTPTYCYLFDFDSDFFNHFRVLNCNKSIRGVSHADDISYLFHNVAAEKLSPTCGEFKCMQRMIAMWCSFALTSNPNCKEIEPSYWKPVDTETVLQEPIQVLNISDDIEFKKLPLHHKLQVWNSFYTKESLY